MSASDPVNEGVGPWDRRCSLGTGDGGLVNDPVFLPVSQRLLKLDWLTKSRPKSIGFVVCQTLLIPYEIRRHHVSQKVIRGWDFDEECLAAALSNLEYGEDDPNSDGL